MHDRQRLVRAAGVAGACTATVRALLLAATGSFIAACGGGGSGGGGLVLESVSVAGNSNWQINRPILFVFSEDVDFSTVNMNSIHIGQTTGGTAVGEFSLVDSRTVKFQPRCPTLADNSDAGLLPGGVSYTVQVPGAGSGGSSVHSISGNTLEDTLTIQFSTIASQDPSVLFIDTKAGPPGPVIRADANDDRTAGTYIELGDDPDAREYFIARTPADVNLGLGMPENASFLSGLNLYSDISSHISILVAVDQAVRASEDNINSNTVQLEYLSASTTWLSVAHTVTLVSNCSGTGALLRVSPAGILPQNHYVRVRFAPDFKDIVGNANIVPVVIGAFLVGTATEPGGGGPGPESDEFKEEFVVDAETAPTISFEDSTTTLPDPRADWANSGLLKAGFAFTGTGGQGGAFDWKIGNDLPLSPTNHPEVSLDTAFAVITNEQQTLQQNVIGGVVDIRNLTVTACGTLNIRGPNPCTILVSGSAVINGRIQLIGTSNLSVGTLDTTGQTESGALGTAGGGDGGNGNPLTTQSSPKGANGNGAFQALGRGGVGGESAYQPAFPADGDDSHRRPAGGGGGTLGHDFLRPSGINSGYTNPNQCPDQARIGFDAESGFAGYPGDTRFSGAVGAISGQTPPIGGAPGPRPFADSNAGNDFWGTMLNNSSGQLVKGELTRPWAGAGGGGGGNAINSATFPTTPFDPTADEKGAGGGGGGGGLTILALGDIRFGPTGRIDASGGTGGGGENSLQTGDVTHIGGGSGGGSGGHIILQTASTIDLSLLTSADQPAPGWPGGLYALGGEGGAGKNNVGGARPLGQALGPCLDALPPNSYPSTSSNTPCRMVSGTGQADLPGYTCTNMVGDDGQGGDPPLVVICAGGDGGAGLIQFHAPALPNGSPNVTVPTTPGENIYSVCKPPPVGSFPGTGVPSYGAINSPGLWDRLLPIFGRKSQAISKWISLGDAAVSSNASTTVPNPIQFVFGGTSNGIIQSTGAQVAELPPILTGTIQSGTTKPYIDTDMRTIVFDSTTLVDADDIYLRNVALMRRFLVRFSTPTVFDFEVGTAEYDPTSSTLRLTVSASGSPLLNLEGAAVEVRPRFFRVVTDDTPNFLPATSQITVRFQATQPDFQGNPSLDPNLISAWTFEISDLDPNVAPHPNYKFLRFEISFDISANNEPLTPSTPIPGLDFFRTPFRF